MRKSFILHLDSLCILDELTLEQKGILFDAIYRYQLGEEVELDFAMKLAFIPFKNQFERDAEKYDDVIEKRRAAGSKGGKSKQMLPNDSKSKHLQTNQADSVSVSVSDSKNESVSDSVSNGLPAFVADAADTFFVDLITQLRVHHQTGIAIELREHIAKKKNGYLKLVKVIPLFIQKRSYFKIQEPEIDKYLVEWLEFNTKNKAVVEWKNYSEIAQHAINFIDKKIKSKQNEQPKTTVVIDESSRDAGKEWFGKL